MTTLRVEVSAGELVDKITILEIKSERLTDPAKLANVANELAALTRARTEHLPPATGLDDLTGDLKAVNEALWDIENAVRKHESEKDFGAAFIDLVRSVYLQNDRRAALKRRINELTGSRLIEEKSYSEY